jgi:hypothetical protein
MKFTPTETTRALANLNLLEIDKDELDTIDVRFSNNALYYVAENTTKSINISKEKLIEIIDKNNIGGNGNELFVQNIFTPIHFGDIKTILMEAVVNKFRVNIIELKGSAREDREQMFQILKENSEPMWAEQFYKEMRECDSFDNNYVFKFDATEGTNKWSQIGNSTVSPNMTVKEFVSKYQ